MGNGAITVAREEYTLDEARSVVPSLTDEQFYAASQRNGRIPKQSLMDMLLSENGHTVVWNCQVDQSGFKGYDREIAAKIEWGHRNNKSPVEWQAYGHNYRLDWGTMSQLNIATGKARRVERKVVSWQYEADWPRGYRPFDEDMQGLLEAAFMKRYSEPTTYIHMNGFQYLFDWNHMTQTNTSSGRQRLMNRIENIGSEKPSHHVDLERSNAIWEVLLDDGWKGIEQKDVCAALSRLCRWQKPCEYMLHGFSYWVNWAQ